MTNEELKRCPFCGGTANIAKGRIEFWAYCPHCGARTEFYETEQEAVAAWNRRKIEENLQKELNEAIEDNCENMEYHVLERARLRSLLKSCCNEFAPRNSNYPVCSRANWCVDAKGHCFERKECPIYAELTKFDGSKDMPDGRLVEFPKLKKAMEKIGDGDGKFSFPPMFPKVNEDET